MTNFYLEDPLLKKRFHSPEDIQQNTLDILSSAINKKSFFLVAQPIVSYDNKVQFYEILARIFISDNNILYPNDFIPKAQSAGLLPSMDKAIITQTVKFIHQTSNENYFSINVFPETLIEYDFIRFVKNLFIEYNIAPYRIAFEIIESGTIDSKQICGVVNELRNIGCLIAIDDFGVDFSNYSRLKLLNIDFLKIDGSFIREIMLNDFDKKAVQSFCEIAKLKNAKVIAEFVESEDVLNFLTSLGIDFFQGYHTGKPIALNKI